MKYFLAFVFAFACLLTFSGPLGAQTFAPVPAISFTKPFAGADPLPQTLTIASVGAGFNFSTSSSVITPSGGTWLSVSPGPGCCESTPYAITATVTTLATMAVGSYSGQIVVTSQGGAQSMQINVTLTVTSTSTAFLDNLPGQKSFSLVTGGTAITSQDIQVRNGGTGTLNWSLSASTSDGGNWLVPTATSGMAPQTISVGVNVASLPGGGMTAGSFLGQLLFQGSGSSTTVPVVVVVGANILSQVNPINFVKVFAGANPLPQTLMIPSTGTNFNFFVTFSTATGGSWLSVSPGNNGCCESTPNTITATVVASPALAVGTYTGQIVVTSQGGGMSITIPVTLTVAPGTLPFFDNVPGQVSFTLVTGATNNPPAQLIQIRNAGPGILSWTLSVSTSDGGNWLGASELSGTAPSTVSVTVDKNNLPGMGLIAGSFVGELVFRTTGSSVTVPVNVVVGANVFSQVNAINFVKVFSGANPLPQILSVPSTGTNFNFFVTFSTATGGSWLSVSPGNNGCCEATPNTIVATVNASPTLAVGTYTGQIVVTSQGGGMSITIPVTLQVEAAGDTFFDNVQGQVSFFIPTASGNPPTQSVNLRNAGSGVLDWSVTASTADGGSWLTVSAPGGTAPSTVNVGVVANSLPNNGLVAGTFNGQLVFQGGGTTVTIPVSVYVGTNIFVEAGSLSFSRAFGAANPAPQNVNITSTGSNFSFFVTSSTATGGSWLSVSPSNNGCCEATPRTVMATIVASPSFPAGGYTGEIVLESQGGAFAMTIPLYLNVGTSGTGASRTFVSTTGNDANEATGCSAVANCRTFAAALAATSPGGEIVVVNSGGYGPVTISESIVISAVDVASISVTTSGANGITINTPGNVTLSGLALHGEATGNDGILVQRVGFLRLYNVLIENFLNDGVNLAVGGDLDVYDSTFSDNGHDGILLQDISALAYVYDSIFDDNKNAGVEVVEGQASVADSSAHFNLNAFLADGGTLTLFNDRAIFNGTGLATSNGGTLYFAACLLSNNTTAYNAGVGSTLAGSNPGSSLIAPGQIKTGTLTTAIKSQ
jgi:hypothetical protein